MMVIQFVRRFSQLSKLNLARNLKLAKFQCRKMSQNGAKKTKIEVFTTNTIGTHSGTFHCDEILAVSFGFQIQKFHKFSDLNREFQVYMLSQLPEFSNHKLLRSRDQEKLNQCDIVVDVGSVFDPATKRYDHHQSTFQETFSSLRPDLGKVGDVR